MSRTLIEQAGDLQRITAQLVKKFQFRDRNETVAYGLSVSQAYALRALSELGPLTMGGFAEEMRLTVSTMTRIVDQLERKSLVRRAPSQIDRRIVEVALTTRGKAQWQRIEDELVASDMQVLRTISSAERETVIRAIAQLSEAIERWRAEKLEQGV